MKLLGFDTGTILRIEPFAIPILSKRVLQNVKNSKIILLCYIQRGKRWKAKFRNGLEVEFDRYSVFKVYQTCTLLSRGYEVSKSEDGRFLMEGNGIKMIGKEPVPLEDLERSYRVVDYTGKVVLDVGGYTGDTAVLFRKWGARKVIVYEPLEENVEYIKRNVELNDIDAEIHPLAVCDKCGETELMVDRKFIGTEAFGLTRPGEYKVKLNAISWKEVLEDAIEKNVEIAKVDCEGCERFLLDIKDELKKIPHWIIEIHSKDLEKDLVTHFVGLGFNYKRHSRFDSVLFFTFPKWQRRLAPV